jgi:hypothetical protein
MPGIRIPKQILLLTALCLFVLVFPSGLWAQQAPEAPPNAPDSGNTFSQPQGVPNYSNAPNEQGKFKNPQKTERKAGQLMDPGESYPPPGVKRMLLLLLVFGVIAFYFVFLRGKLKSILSFAGKIAGKASKPKKVNQSGTNKVKESVFEVVHERTDNEKILRDMYFKLEAEKQKKKQVFGNLSFRNSAQWFETSIIPGIDLKENGIYVFSSDSQTVSKVLMLNIIIAKTGKGRIPVLFTGSLSMEDIADAILLSETEKSWSELEESEKYRIERLSEDFMGKYESISVMREIPVGFEQWRTLIAKLKENGKPSVIILDGSSVIGDLNKELLNNLDTISSKEGIQIYILLKTGQNAKITPDSSLVKRTFCLTKESDNDFKITDSENNSTIIKLKINSGDKKLSVVKSDAK